MKDSVLEQHTEKVQLRASFFLPLWHKWGALRSARFVVTDLPKCSVQFIVPRGGSCKVTCSSGAEAGWQNPKFQGFSATPFLTYWAIHLSSQSCTKHMSLVCFKQTSCHLGKSHISIYRALDPLYHTAFLPLEVLDLANTHLASGLSVTETQSKLLSRPLD